MGGEDLRAAVRFERLECERFSGSVCLVMQNYACSLTIVSLITLSYTDSHRSVFSMGCSTLNVSEKKRLVRHSTALVQCTAWQRKEINCTRAVHKKYHHTRRFHELVGNPHQSRPPIFQSYFLRSFFRSFVRHRHPVAASYRLFSRRRGLTSSVSHLGHASRDQEALEQLRGHVATVLEDAVERARAAVVVAAESAAFREGRRRK